MRDTLCEALALLQSNLSVLAFPKMPEIALAVSMQRELLPYPGNGRIP